MRISFNKSASLKVIYDPVNVRISVSNKLVQGLIVCGGGGGAAPPIPPLDPLLKRIACNNGLGFL